MSRTWQPWDDFRVTEEETRLPIEGPPCADCWYWKPVRIYGDSGEYAGVRLCQHDDQCTDFSCYKAKP